jgi:hypothetical protein
MAEGIQLNQHFLSEGGYLQSWPLLLTVFTFVLLSPSAASLSSHEAPPLVANTATA